MGEARLPNSYAFVHLSPSLPIPHESVEKKARGAWNYVLLARLNRVRGTSQHPKPRLYDSGWVDAIMPPMKRFSSADSPPARPKRTPKPWRKRLWWLALIPVLCLGAGALLRWWTDYRYGALIYTIETVPPRRVAIVFGAAVWPDGSPSPVLADRVQTAVNLYHAGRVEKLLMTGDNSYIEYNEPKAMAEFAQSLGVPANDIVLDYAGRRTYDSCYRARHIFGVSDAILVTQSYHLDRALFTAHALGLDAVGVGADLREYTQIRQWWWREFLATPVAWLEVHGILRPQPILGEPLPIFDD